jgi:hypothetical protein
MVVDFQRLLTEPCKVTFARETARLIHLLAENNVLKRDLVRTLSSLPEIVVYGLPFELRETRSALTLGDVTHEAGRIYHHYEMLIGWGKNLLAAIDAGQRANILGPVSVRRLAAIADADIHNTDGYRFVNFPEIPKDAYYKRQIIQWGDESPASHRDIDY